MSVFIVGNNALSSDLIGSKVKNKSLIGTVIGVKVKANSTGFLIKINNKIEFWDFNDCEFLS